MIGILIVAHGAFGEALIHSASHVLGKRPLRVRQVGVTVHDDPEAILPQARDLVRQLDEGSGVLVLTDIYGATPGNIALRLLEPGRVEGISGVNLPMLIRALTYREQGLAITVEKALSGGTEGVIHMTVDSCGKDHAGRGETDHGGRDGQR
jgi:PTS system mannose-specific IIA component